ncbi:hypothetical protein HBN85_07895 [Pseudomonas fragi]|uniref:hypothetical protein n=1 Tax=Pseudomonas fragi TaxID=296 RepID=UPI0014737FCE|nr:hypothetical protein [Pseudomonas fragi]NNA84693.1 hypothetical protein [Pseudomonas fragi]NNB37893.1 hypothetical protein [Pseudomonas fragi]
MFRSHETFAEGAPNIFGDGYSNWRIFERHLAHPWYHVVLEECLDGKVWPRTMMISDIDMLDQILSQQTSEFVITEIQVVTPGWMNKTGQWMMEKLLGLLVGYDSGGARVCLHNIGNEKAYSDALGRHIDAHSLKRLRVIL